MEATTVVVTNGANKENDEQLTFRKNTTSLPNPSSYSDLPPSSLDSVPTQFDYTAVPSFLTQEQRKKLQEGPHTPQNVYGRGPNSLIFSNSKRLTIACSVLCFVFASLVLEFICYYQGFCFAEETTGSNSQIAGGARRVFSVQTSQAVVPICLLLAFVVAPSGLAAAASQVMLLCLVSFVLNATACGLLVISGIGLFALLPKMDETARETWNTLPLLVRSMSYQNNFQLLVEEMKTDAANVGTASLAGACITGLCAICLFPMASTQFYAFVAGCRGGAKCTSLCCAVTPLSHIHDGAYAQIDFLSFLQNVTVSTMDRMCPIMMGRWRIWWSSSTTSAALSAQNMVVNWGGAGAWRNRGGGILGLCSMTTVEAKIAVYRYFGWTLPPNAYLGVNAANANTATATTSSSSNITTNTNAGAVGTGVNAAGKG